MEFGQYNFETYTWEYDLIKRWMILCFWDGCTRTNEIILLYEKSVDIDELLKSCGERYSMVIMIILWRKESILIAVSKKRCVIIWDKLNGSMNRRNKDTVHYAIRDKARYWLKNVLEDRRRMLSKFLNIWWSIRCI